MGFDGPQYMHDAAMCAGVIGSVNGGDIDSADDPVAIILIGIQ
jgi:hypothetical protein